MVIFPIQNHKVWKGFEKVWKGFEKVLWMINTLQDHVKQICKLQDCIMHGNIKEERENYLYIYFPSEKFI